jgi:hypothetical protein
MYSFQNATNEMKAWLPNDFLGFNKVRDLWNSLSKINFADSFSSSGEVPIDTPIFLALAIISAHVKDNKDSLFVVDVPGAC